MTAYATVDSARRALREGAYDYVDKEGEFRDELKAILERAARETRLQAENRRLEGTVDSLKKGLTTVVGESPAVKQALSLAERVAGTDSTVLLRGESGTGKDLFARAIHFAEPRARRTVGQGQLRSASREPARERAVRAREGRLHRRGAPEARAVRGRRLGHAVPRRDRRDAAPAPGEAPAA